MATVWHQITSNLNILIDELTRLSNYIDSYPVLYTIVLLFIMLTVVNILKHCARLN